MSRPERVVDHQPLGDVTGSVHIAAAQRSDMILAGFVRPGRANLSSPAGLVEMD